MHARVALIAVLFAYGCGGSTSTDTGTIDDTGTVADSSTTEASTDSSTTTDSTSTDTGTTPADTGSTEDSGKADAVGVDCGGKVCAADEVCCASGGMGGASFTCTKGSCGDGGATISCDGPEDCSGGKTCCAEAEVTGTGIMCSFKAAMASCTAECKTTIPLGCPGKATIRPCHAAADCTETGYKNCCQFSGGGSTATFCVSDTIKLAAGKCF